MGKWCEQKGEESIQRHPCVSMLQTTHLLVTGSVILDTDHSCTSVPRAKGFTSDSATIYGHPRNGSAVPNPLHEF
jgi:hypothetical protein